MRDQIINDITDRLKLEKSKSNVSELKRTSARPTEVKNSDRADN